LPCRRKPRPEPCHRQTWRPNRRHVQSAQLNCDQLSALQISLARSTFSQEKRPSPDTGRPQSAPTAFLLARAGCHFLRAAARLLSAIGIARSMAGCAMFFGSRSHGVNMVRCVCTSKDPEGHCRQAERVNKRHSRASERKGCIRKNRLRASASKS